MKEEIKEFSDKFYGLKLKGEVFDKEGNKCMLVDFKLKNSVWFSKNEFFEAGMPIFRYFEIENIKGLKNE